MPDYFRTWGRFAHSTAAAVVLAVAVGGAAAMPPSARADDPGRASSSAELQFVADMKDAGVRSKPGPDEYIVLAGYLLCRSRYYGSVSSTDMSDILRYIEYKDFNVISKIADKDLCPGGVW